MRPLFLKINNAVSALLILLLLFFSCRKPEDNEKFHKGKVIDIDELPVPGATVKINDGWGTIGEDITDESGNFKIKIKWSHRKSYLKVIVEKDGFYRPFSNTADLERENKNEATIYLYKKYNSKLAGKVINKDGETLPNYKVELVKKSLSSGTFGEPFLTTFTNEEGKFYIDTFLGASLDYIYFVVCSRCELGEAIIVRKYVLKENLEIISWD